jgi:glycine dehydrogenase
MSILDPESFQSRHIGPDQADAEAMLRTIGAASLDALMDEAIPARIRLPQPLDLPRGKPEYQYLRDLRSVAARNRLFKSYIGLGYYDCVTPSVILSAMCSRTRAGTRPTRRTRRKSRRDASKAC